MQQNRPILRPANQTPGSSNNQPGNMTHITDDFIDYGNSDESEHYNPSNPAIVPINNQSPHTPTYPSSASGYLGPHSTSPSPGTLTPLNATDNNPPWIKALGSIDNAKLNPLMYIDYTNDINSKDFSDNSLNRTMINPHDSSRLPKSMGNTPLRPHPEKLHKDTKSEGNSPHQQKPTIPSSIESI